MTIRDDGSVSSLSSSPDIQLVVLSDTEDFVGQNINWPQFPLGFFCTQDGYIKITTAWGTEMILPVVAHKDNLIQVQRFWLSSFTAGACYAFP